MRNSLIFIIILLSACSVGPDYKRSEINFINQEKFINENHTGSQEWWTQINDPILNSWIKTLEKDNFSLIVAMQRSEQAKQGVVAQGGEFLPTLGIESSNARQQSVTGSFGALGDQIDFGTRKFYNNSFGLKLASSWQVDLFGQIRRKYSSAKANYKASKFEEAYLKQSLISELIRNRVKIANLKKLKKLNKEIIKSRKITLESINRRYSSGAGTVTAFDVRLAKENLTTSQATLPIIERNLKSTYYSTDILLGKAPGFTRRIKKEIKILPAPKQIIIPQPIELIDRRPDLLSNELRLIAASEDIGVAIADLYPNLTISGNYGYQSLDFGDLVSPEQIVWQAAASLTNKLFAGGRLNANIKLKKARAKELEAQYIGSILNALKEVENALLSEKAYRKEYKKLNSSVIQLKSAEEIANNRYTKGLISITDLLDIQRRRAFLEQQILSTELNIWNSRIDLYLSLGGQWVFKEEGK